MLLVVVALVALFASRGSAQMANDDMYTHMMDTETGELYEVLGFETYAFEAPDQYEQLPTQNFAAPVPYRESGTSLSQAAQINEAPSHITNQEINVAADTSNLGSDEVLPTQTSAARVPLQQSSVATNSAPLIREPTFVQNNEPIVVAPSA